MEEAMLTIRFMETDDQDAYMLEKELTYHQITDQVESCYINLLNKEEWMPTKNAMPSKFGANKATTKMMALVQQSGYPKQQDQPCFKCGELGQWRQDCPKLKGNKEKSNGNSNQYQQDQAGKGPIQKSWKLVEQSLVSQRQNRTSVEGLFLVQHRFLFKGTLGVLPTKPVHVKIKSNAKPFHGHAFSVPKAYESMIHNEVECLCRLNVLRRCNESEWAAPPFGTPKKNGQIRFISDFRQLNKWIICQSHLLTLLTALTKKNVKFEWTKEHQQAFDSLKNSLARKVVLAYPDFSVPFEIYTDASKYQIRSVRHYSKGQVTCILLQETHRSSNEIHCDRTRTACDSGNTS
jgi:hypothetical protein